MAITLFFISAVLLFYIYFGYALLLRFLPKKVSPKNSDFKPLPSISILISAYNEEEYIEETLKNKLQLDYPKTQIEILVVSDASTDKTDAIVKKLASTSTIPITLVRQDSRQGKTAGLNRLVTLANSDILIFSDANSIYDASAVKQLVKQFKDPKVGYITGKLIYTQADGSIIGEGCSRYMQYENWLRQQETTISSIVGVDGGIDAMRKSLYSPLTADQLPDFVQPLKVIEQGYQVCYEPTAKLYEQALQMQEQEFRMRVRVCLRALWAIFDMRQLLNPAHYGMFAWQLTSHKLLRYLAFIPQAVILISNLALVGSGLFFQLFFLAQMLIYSFAYYGYRLRDKPNIPSLFGLPYYLLFLNISAAVACYKFLHKEKIVIWQPRQGQV
ncbi:MAG: glycosyltransferase family 2 protein [Pseudomonadales bacterium]|nr:glycosyltransferase family 2 protein [Pseudomonadales bacterium]